MACEHDHPTADMLSNRRKRIAVLTMMWFTGGYMLVEAVVGLITGSLALFGDAIHMASDLASLVIGYVAIRLSVRERNSHYTYGYSRTEPIAGLINASLVIGIAFFLIVESIDRFIEREPIQNPVLMLSVASVGLLVNIVGICIFHDSDGHGHGHSHGHSHGHEHGPAEERPRPRCAVEDYMPLTDDGEPVPALSPLPPKRKKGCRRKKVNSQSMAVYGMYIHVLSDLLGSVVAMVSGALIAFLPSSWDWRFYIDPICSLIMVALIVNSTRSLFADSIRLLMQTAPSDMNVDGLTKRIQDLPGIKSVHDLHVWRLTDERVIASVHIVVDGTQPDVAAQVRAIFHAQHIISVTVQIEEVDGAVDVEPHICYAQGGTCSCTAHFCCPETVPVQTASPAEDADEAAHHHDHDHEHEHEHKHDHSRKGKKGRKGKRSKHDSSDCSSCGEQVADQVCAVELPTAEILNVN